MAADLKVLRQIDNRTQSVNGCLIEEQLFRTSAHPIWNDGALCFFEERRPNENKHKNNKMSSDMGSWCNK